MEHNEPPPIPAELPKKRLTDVNPLVFAAAKKKQNLALKQLLKDPKSAIVIAEILRLPII